MNIATGSKIKQMSIQLLVADLDRSIGFYAKLGFQLEFRHEDFYAGVTKDGFSIHLKIGVPSAEERRNKQDNEHLDIMFSVDDIQSLFRDMTSNAISILQPLRIMPYGKEFYILDPDRYIIAFLEST